MNNKNQLKVIMWLIVSMLAISLFFTFHLLVVEYIRILILGMSLAIVSITNANALHKSHVKVYLVAGAYAYVLWLLDPAVNGVAFFGEGAQAFNFYRVVTLSILIVSTVLWLFPLITRKISFKDFFSNFTKTDFYILIGILSVGILFMLMESARAITEKTSVVEAVLQGTKFIDCALIFFLILQGSFEENKVGKKYIYTLLYAFLFFAIFTSLVGAGKAAAAYYTARIPKKLEKSLGATRTKKLLMMREKLLRVFSLNSHEALVVYEAGYAAGQKNWRKSLDKLKEAEKFPKKTVDEEKLIALLNTGENSKALQLLEAFPRDYKFKISNAKNEINKFTSKLRKDNFPLECYYLSGLLYKHLGEREESEKYLKEFLAGSSSNANALFFLYNGNSQDLQKYPVVEMPAAGWLHPRTSEKAIENNGNIITLVNNQQIEGKLWINPGKYSVTILARDAGTPYEKAKESGFDPTCKLRVWINDHFETLRVLSTNRMFNAYSFEMEIKKNPTDVVIEFTNDTYDKNRGWDRNVSISKITFRQIGE